MTIPLDNLYHYIDGLFPEPVCLYLFYPHGSRNILDLRGLKTFNKLNFDLDVILLPQVICIDQEPLNYDLYENFSSDEIAFYQNFLTNTNIDENLRFAIPFNIHDNPILLHSEKNSESLIKYKKDGYIDIHYWCHALIARDWYRFAKHDRRLIEKTTPRKDFLIYCREWSGSREYRIKFQEMLYNADLTKNSITGIKKVNDSIENFIFKNKNFIPHSTDFFYQLTDNLANSTASADYCPDDFLDTRLSVVLETVFDGPTIHLTEKILRPIACGHPFILASGPKLLVHGLTKTMI